jgi:hypothetical protein
MAVDRLKHFLEVAADAPPERDRRHFRAWQRVSVEVQREVRSLAVKTYFAHEWHAAADLDRAFTIVVYSSCQPCYGRRPMEFTYDICALATLTTPLRLVGRSLQARLVEISTDLQADPRMQRRFAPVWHVDILNAVKKKPRELIELLAREATMIEALIDLGTMRDGKTTRRFVKSAVAVARMLGIDSRTLQDLVLGTGAKNLVDGGTFENDDVAASGSPDAGIGGDEDGHHGSTDGRSQVADAGVVADIHACG